VCFREDEEEEGAAVTDPEGKPVKEKTIDTSATSQNESKEGVQFKIV